MSESLSLIDVFAQQIEKADLHRDAALKEPLSVVADHCLQAFKLAHAGLKSGKPADTTFTNSHSNTKNRTDLTRAIADAYGFTILGEDSPHKKHNPASIQIFEELKVAASALYTSGKYLSPRVRVLAH